MAHSQNTVYFQARFLQCYNIVYCIPFEWYNIWIELYSCGPRNKEIMTFVARWTAADYNNLEYKVQLVSNKLGSVNINKQMGNTCME